MSGPTLWDTVIVNMAPIIIALTGFGAMFGGFWMQKRMMDRQNEKIDRNANEAATARSTLSSKIEEVKKATNGMKDELVEAARSEGIRIGRDAAKSESPP